MNGEVHGLSTEAGSRIDEDDEVAARLKIERIRESFVIFPEKMESESTSGVNSVFILC